MKPPRQRVYTGSERAARMRSMDMGSDMFDMSDAYGRGIRTSAGKVKGMVGEQTEQGLGDLTALGASPEQLLKFRKGVAKEGLGAMGDVVSSGTQAQAGAMFGATENRNAMAVQNMQNEYARQHDLKMMEGSQGFQERMWGKENAWSREQQAASEKAARRNAWLGFAGNLGGAAIKGLLPMLGG